MQKYAINAPEVTIVLEALLLKLIQLPVQLDCIQGPEVPQLMTVKTAKSVITAHSRESATSR